MAAASTDKLRKIANNFSTTLGSAIGAADTAMSLNLVSGLPTDTAVDLVIDRVDTNGTKTPTKREYVRGVVSGSTVISLTRGLGNSTAQTHALSAVVEMVWTSDTHNDMVDALTASLNQDGTIKTNAVFSANQIADGIITSAELAPASVTNAKLSTTAGDVGGAWKSWTPTFQNFSLGSGTMVAKYTQIGKTVHFHLNIAFGSGTTPSNSNDFGFTPPVPYANYAAFTIMPIGAFHFENNGVQNYEGFIILSNADQILKPLLLTAGGDGYVHWRSITNTVPKSPYAAGDLFECNGTYEAA
jgi:hypothetical protein